MFRPRPAGRATEARDKCLEVDEDIDQMQLLESFMAFKFILAVSSDDVTTIDDSLIVHYI